MKKIASSFIFLALSGAWLPSHAVLALPDLSDWIGKYPSDRIAPSGRTMLSIPEIKAALGQLLPRHELKTLSEFDVETPVRRTGGYLIVEKCRPHECSADFAVLVFSEPDGRLWVALFNRSKERVSSRFYGNSDDWSVLPDDVKSVFSTRLGS
ncbi:hypothetical protein [Derxia gummosa]|uniref:Inhibitor of vertebrate lysozyme (Ivy) n=1 Tax=Derxia gummosa DSM 723 TaxID=1121388 RepID=A0A8B6XC94_9BURK|nr:hypothetical protein [Derxia gummosa]